MIQPTAALMVRLEAQIGKEAEVEKFLRGGLEFVQREPGIITWYAIKMGPSTFCIFGTFANESGRETHLSGKVAAALQDNAPGLFAKLPTIEKAEVLAAKLP